VIRVCHYEGADVTEGYLWGNAEVTHPGWSGNAQLDQRGFEEAVGLDPKVWLAIGLHVGGGEHTHNLRVVAVQRDLVPEGGDGLPEIAAANGGEIPATEFKIHDLDPYTVLKAVAHMFAMRLTLQRAAEWPIRIMSLSDVPERRARYRRK